jgi:hypothetical protein
MRRRSYVAVSGWGAAYKAERADLYPIGDICVYGANVMDAFIQDSHSLRRLEVRLRGWLASNGAFWGRREAHKHRGVFLALKIHGARAAMGMTGRQCKEKNKARTARV